MYASDSSIGVIQDTTGSFGTDQNMADLSFAPQVTSTAKDDDDIVGFNANGSSDDNGDFMRNMLAPVANNEGKP